MPPDSHGAVIRYTPSELSSLRNHSCSGLSRSLKRFIFYLGISNRSHKCGPLSVTTSQEKLHIPVRAVPRACKTVVSNQRHRPRNLLRIKFENFTQRQRRKVPFSRRTPSLIVTNVRSLPNKLDEVSSLLVRHAPDIAMFCESWLDDTIPDSVVSLPDYQVLRKDRNRFGGGIISYVRDYLSPTILTSNEVPSLASCQSEFLPILLPNLLLIGIYHPFWNSSSLHHEAISCLADILDYSLTCCLDPCNARILICGDFNDLRLYYDEISRVTDSKSLVEFPTRDGNTLDQIFTNMPTGAPPIRLPPIGKSDHATIFWAQSSVKCPSIKREVRNISKYNKARFSELVNQIDWLSLLSSTHSLNLAASTLLSTLHSIYDFCFPSRVIRLRHSDPPWMKASLKIILDKRDRAYAEGKHLKYLRLRNEAASHAIFLKKSYMCSAMTARDAKKTWNAIKLLGRCRKPQSSSALFTAQELADFFSSVHSTTSPASCSSSSSSHALCFNSLPKGCMQTSVCEVFLLLRKTKKKSPGPDGVPFWIFRDFASLLAPAITFLFNESLRLGLVPECFKYAFITAIPKCLRPSMPSHYRPISLLPILSKLLEKIVVKRWILPVIQQRLSASQFAYLPRRGTAVAMTLMYDQILRFLDSKSGAVRLLMVDFEKAFDKLPHEKIIQSCIDFNLSKSTVLWIRDFLAGRKQCVRVNSSLSSWHPIHDGVPQGSILGPFLFCMVMDSFSPIDSTSTVIKYADDLSILHFVRYSDQDRAQSEWDNVVSWSHMNGLSINYSKCSVMNFVTKKNMSLNTIVTHLGPLSSVTSSKVLGVYLRSDLKWNAHVNAMTKRGIRNLYILRYLKKCSCPPSVLRSAYFAFVRSHFLFCCPVLVNMPDYLKSKILHVEKRAAKIIGDDIVPDYDSAVEKVCRSLFANIAKDDEHPLRDLFVNRDRFLRNDCPLRAPLAKTVRFKTSFIRFCK